MLRHCSLAIVITILLLTIDAARFAAPQEANNRAAAAEEKLDSRRLAALAKDIKSGNRAALEAFWRDLKDKAPLVEPVIGDEKRLWVTYVWRGDNDAKRVDVIGGAPAGDEFAKPLARLLDTDLWY